MTIYGNKVFRNPAATIRAFSTDEFPDAFRELERLQKDTFLAGYIRYEARFAFSGLPCKKTLPLLYFEAFDAWEPFDPQETAETAEAEAPPLEEKSVITFDQYRAAVAAIKEEIRNGNTYEVNYTYDRRVSYNGRPLTLFRTLLQRQNTPYAFYTQNPYDTILSFSPELFFRIAVEPDGERRIVAKPMKGTVRRGKDAAEDRALVEFLRNDVKNRAENVMIVDLLRNDIGRVAQMGSVRATNLFNVETHPTLHTMTSQVEALLRPRATLHRVFQALFPCGSVTGAPKTSTMDIIDRVETGERNIYCGAIGLLSPGGTAEFSVPIRILQKARDEDAYTYRVGGAIVWDSSPEDEWLETLTKTKFLHRDFSLIETMKAENGVIPFASAHNARIKQSAAHFSFIYRDDILKLSPTRDGIVRFTLQKSGRFTVEERPLVETDNNTICVSPLRVQSGDPHLRHKTSYRPLFTADYAAHYDEVFFNERGELTEGTRTNIVLKIEGAHWTPPLSSGLLPGIYRQYMLERGQCAERVLYRADLEGAEEIHCVNSVRGKRLVHLFGARHSF
jgi:para-aminobenzoate synthetase/4-amino-4-deoxychorismate lyase